ncbi:hypothetical protein GCM10020331_064340 [Ectobacillus funiculus]
MQLLQKRMYMYLRSLGFQMEPIDEPFLFHETLVGVPIRLHAWQGMKYLYSLKEFRDVIHATPQAQQLIQENEKKDYADILSVDFRNTDIVHLFVTRSHRFL